MGFTEPCRGFWVGILVYYFLLRQKSVPEDSSTKEECKGRYYSSVTLSL